MNLESKERVRHIGLTRRQRKEWEVTAGELLAGRDILGCEFTHGFYAFRLKVARKFEKQASINRMLASELIACVYRDPLPRTL